METLGAAAPRGGLLMTPPPEPEVPYPTSADQWVCANDFGATTNDETNDTEALQKAIDAAAQRGATTVYLLGGKRGDPNYYRMDGTVRIHGSVQRVMGFGFARLLAPRGPADPATRAAGATTAPAEGGGRGGASAGMMLVIDDDPQGAPVVAIECLHNFGASGFGIDVRSPNRTVLVRAGDARLTARANTTVFISNCVGRLTMEPGATVWARHWNTEGGGSGRGSANNQNDGGQLWILGLKTERVALKVASLNGGRTEVLGVHNYNYTGTAADDQTPFALVENASMSIAGYREATFTGRWWRVPALARMGQNEDKYPMKTWCAWSLLRIGQ
jgi:hypothetical protein